MPRNEGQYARLLHEGVEAWNQWRRDNPDESIDLTSAEFPEGDYRNLLLHRAELSGIGFGNGSDLTGANFSGSEVHAADLAHLTLVEANFTGAKLDGVALNDCNLQKARLNDAYSRRGAEFMRSDLTGAILTGAVLRQAKLVDATLCDANLNRAVLVGSVVEGASFRGATVYGASAWDLEGEPRDQSGLIITPRGQPEVRVDNLELAQFVYLLLRNDKIRDVISTIGEKGVLILGRFTEERKAVLEAIRKGLRQLGFAPMMFDFERAEARDFKETVRILASMSRFIIADVTKPRSVPAELEAIVPNYMVPLVPILHKEDEPYALLENLQNTYPWVLDVLEYDSVETLMAVLRPAVVEPALVLSDKLIGRRAEAIRVRQASDYLDGSDA